MTPGQLVTLTVGIVAAGAAIVAALVPLWSEARRRRRDQYAAAIRVLAAWVEFPYRVARRVSDEAEVLTSLAGRGHDLQEDLACHMAWIAADSRSLGDLYSRVADAVKAAVRPAAQRAWEQPPAATGQSMNIGALGIDDAGVHVLLHRLHRAVRHRFGTRRLIGWVWRWALPTFKSAAPTPLTHTGDDG